MRATQPPPPPPDGSRFIHGVTHAAASHVGHVRTNNEDAWRVDAQAQLYAVADGMGGHDAGEVASSLCLETFFREMSDAGATAAIAAFLADPTLETRRGVKDQLRRAASGANQAVRAEAQRLGSQSGLGCTLDAALLLLDRAFVLHVGDGRIYVARAAATIQLTHDHDLIAVLAAEGRLPTSRRSSVRNQLLNAIGMNAEVSADATSIELLAGDRLLLCTDGVHDLIGDEAAIADLMKAGTPTDAAGALVTAALSKGGRDNATALIVAVMESQITRARSAEATMDLHTAGSSPLFVDLPDALVLQALTTSVEIEFEPEETIARIVTTDHVAYIVVQGEVALGSLSMGAGALLYPESLLGKGRGQPCFRATTRVRVLRVRADDFRELCSGNSRLAAALYERLARHLAHGILPG